MAEMIEAGVSEMELMKGDKWELSTWRYSKYIKHECWLVWQN